MYVYIVYVFLENTDQRNYYSEQMQVVRPVVKVTYVYQCYKQVRTGNKTRKWLLPDAAGQWGREGRRCEEESGGGIRLPTFTWHYHIYIKQFYITYQPA